MAADQLVDGGRRWRHRREVETAERKLGLVETPEQKEAPDLELPRMSGVREVAVRFGDIATLRGMVCWSSEE